ncbi:MAG TPA: hypothetical protein VNJ01_08550 [Bacteriovoracaceae bacterium]|nr:hypothetical protein [Bacteriovoracaceae bacterium]
MSKYMVIFFADATVPEHVDRLRGELSKRYTCFQSRTPDEFNQSYHQSGKFVILFSEAKEAVTFLQGNSKDLTGLEYRAFVYLNKNGKFSPESLKILENNKIVPFSLNESDKLTGSIDSYFSESKSDDFNLDDIQFIMPKDD